jgi:hypothetical protein
VRDETPISVIVLLMLPAATVHGQSGRYPKRNDSFGDPTTFEGKRVTLRIDMPGTSDGVDVQGDTAIRPAIR